MTEEHEYYIYVFEPTRSELITNPDSWTEGEIQISERHFNYLQQANEAGILLLAGRSLDGIGPAIVILESDSESDAQVFMQSDPFVKEGLMRAHLHPFRPALVRKYP